MLKNISPEESPCFCLDIEKEAEPTFWVLLRAAFLSQCEIKGCIYWYWDIWPQLSPQITLNDFLHDALQKYWNRITITSSLCFTTIKKNFQKDKQSKKKKKLFMHACVAYLTFCSSVHTKRQCRLEWSRYEEKLVSQFFICEWTALLCHQSALPLKIVSARRMSRINSEQAMMWMWYMACICLFVSLVGLFSLYQLYK